MSVKIISTKIAMIASLAKLDVSLALTWVLAQVVLTEELGQIAIVQTDTMMIKNHLNAFLNNHLHNMFPHIQNMLSLT